MNDLKKKFADVLFENPNNYLLAAKAAYPDDMSTALTVSSEWKNDPEILNYIKGLVSKPKELASKDELCREVWETAQDLSQSAADTKLKYLELYAKLTGAMYKPVEAKPDVDPDEVRPTVMLIPVESNEYEWRKNAKAQQMKLVVNAGPKQ